jgi:spermidine synthase
MSNPTAAGKIVLWLIVAGTTPVAAGRVIHTEHSLYQNILVTESGNRLCMKFSLRENQRNQSCVDRSEPRKMVFGYTRMMMSGLLVNPAPKRILVVGMGGGTLPLALAALLPDSHIDIVEIDSAVVRMAREYFGFASGPRLRVVVQDARVYGKRAALRGERYDLILLDAFTADYIPEHLMTAEYLAETRALLTDDGVLTANTFGISRLYDHESTTYESIFGPFLNLKTWNSANRIIVAAKAALPSKLELEARATQLKSALRPYGVPIHRYPRQMSRRRDWDTSARVLTDQYSPANLLRGARS